MAARVSFAVAIGLVVGVASCATSQDVPLDLGDESAGNVLPPEAGVGGALDGVGGTSSTGDGGGSPVVSSGGTSSGGRSGSSAGGGPSGGGRAHADAGSIGGRVTGSSGGAATGDAGPACPSGEKICQSDGKCWAIAPSKGCDLGDGCSPCPAPPANGFSMCSKQACDFDCLSGFRKDAAGTGCERGNATGGTTGAGGTMNGSGGRGRGGRGGTGGGTGGASGAGGSPAPCNRSSCPDCNNILQSPCCKDDDTCGCGLLGIGALCN